MRHPSQEHSTVAHERASTFWPGLTGSNVTLAGQELTGIDLVQIGDASCKPANPLLGDADASVS